MGKTAMLLQCLLAIAMQGLPVVVFSMEMSARQLSYRLLSTQTGIEASRLRVGRLSSDNDWTNVSAGISRLAGLPFYIVDRANLTVADIRTKVRHLAAQHGALGMVGIDYLQLMGESSSNRVNELGQITRSLKQLAREIDCPINVLSQLSRGVESRTNKRPMMPDLRESGNIEQDSDLIMMLYREEYYDPDTSDRGIAEMILAKHRNGPTGTVKLLFEKEYTRFRNLARA
jgi:replicative DNA helicase